MIGLLLMEKWNTQTTMINDRPAYKLATEIETQCNNSDKAGWELFSITPVGDSTGETRERSLGSGN